MNRPRAAAVVTWAYAAMFGIPAAPVAIFLAENGRLPSLWGLFDMYGGPWSAGYPEGPLTLLLLAFLGLTGAAAVSGLLLWSARKSGAALNLVLLPVEAVFWIGFALPLPWLIGIARVVLISRAWTSLARRGGHTAAPGS